MKFREILRNEPRDFGGRDTVSRMQTANFQSGFPECGKQFAVARKRQIGVHINIVQRNGGVSLPAEEFRCFPVRAFTVETDQFDTVFQIDVFRFRIEKVEFEDHDFFQPFEERKEFFRVGELLFFRVRMDPDEFADPLGDEFTDPLLKMIRFHTGDFRKTAQTAYFLSEQGE